MPEFWADFDQIFGQAFEEIFGQVFDQGFWPGFWGQKMQFYRSTGAEKYCV